ncbi:FAD-dependent monooxygenase [Saccharopolyspora hordei]
MGVLVVGAGPTGLALACALRAHDVPVRVIDRAGGPATTSRANILHARGVEVLNRLGALGDLPERAQPAVQLTLRAGHEPLATVRFGEIEGRQLRALFIPQTAVEEALHRRLTELGGSVEWGRELTDLAQGPDGVTATVSGETAHADYVVGCDGAHSAVRRLAGIGFPGVALADQWLLADVTADWDLDRRGSSGWFSRDGVFFAIPMRSEHDDAWRVMADAEHADGDVLDQLRRLLVERTGQADAVLREADWTSVFRIHRRLADSYRAGRVLLAGDAAHIHSPFGGQGMNTGIGDAENLAWKLALVVQGRASAALLDTYQAERRPLAEDVLRGTTATTRVLLTDGAVGRAARAVTARVARLGPVQRYATWLASQLWVTYREGPLGARRGPRPRPGDRVPDLVCRDADGRRTRLHAELRGRWAVLGGDGVSLGEPFVHLAPERPLRGTWLVRPDGHLAWRGDTPGQLLRWFETTLRTGRAA